MFALTMITELGDVKRFAHLRWLGQRVLRAGREIRENAFGGKSNRLGVTRQGSRYLRRALMKAIQRVNGSVVHGKDVKARPTRSSPDDRSSDNKLQPNPAWRCVNLDVDLTRETGCRPTA